MENKELRIYLKKETNTFVGVDLENKRVSTRSSYPNEFFDSLNKKKYKFCEVNSMFNYDEVDVIKATPEEIVFLDISDNIYEYNGKKEDFDKERYFYIGNAKNKKELLELLNKEKK